MSVNVNDKSSTSPETPAGHDLLGFSRSCWETFLSERGLPAYRARQLVQWLHQHRRDDWADMTNLPKALREELAGLGPIDPMVLLTDKKARCGTRKFLFKIGNSAIETVLIPEAKRNTLCISSQAGCLLDCRFCSTGKQGFHRNLTAGEIIGQLRYVQKVLDAEGEGERVTNVVMMGMGEPLLNEEPVFKALQLMRDDLAYGLSKRRVTVSTSGIVPAIYRLSKECDVSLAISLHAPTDALRTDIMSINRKYPLDALMGACRQYLSDAPNRHITVEYIMLDGVNDTPQVAKQLRRFLNGLVCKVNLIPFNPFPGSPYRRSSDEAIQAFRDILKKGGFVTTIRKTRGDDIDAACGQLAGQVADRTRRQERWQARMPIHVTKSKPSDSAARD